MVLGWDMSQLVWALSDLKLTNQDKTGKATKVHILSLVILPKVRNTARYLSTQFRTIIFFWRLIWKKKFQKILTNVSNNVSPHVLWRIHDSHAEQQKDNLKNNTSPHSRYGNSYKSFYKLYVNKIMAMATI